MDKAKPWWVVLSFKQGRFPLSHHTTQYSHPYLGGGWTTPLCLSLTHTNTCIHTHTRKKSYFKFALALPPQSSTEINTGIHTKLHTPANARCSPWSTGNRIKCLSHCSLPAERRGSDPVVVTHAENKKVEPLGSETVVSVAWQDAENADVIVMTWPCEANSTITKSEEVQQVCKKSFRSTYVPAGFTLSSAAKCTLCCMSNCTGSIRVVNAVGLAALAPMLHQWNPV